MASIINATTSTGLVSSADNSGSLQLATNNGTTAVTIDTSQTTTINSPSSTPLIVQSAGTERMRITSAGDVGIGTSSPSGKLEVSGGQLRVTASSASSMFLVNPSTTYADGVDLQATYNGGGSFGPLKFTTSGTERMRVGSDGVLCVGRTSASVSTNMVVDGNGGLTIERTSNGYRRMTMTSSIMYFFNGSNEATLSSSGAWTNASDARLKTNIEPIKYGLNTVLETQPRSFNRVDVEGDYIGFVAQELKEKIPEVVFGEEERQYSVDYGSLVAVAFKAIQELSASVDTLNAKVEAQAIRIAELEGAK